MPVPVLFFVHRGIDRENFLPFAKLLIADDPFAFFLDSVSPRITNTITELLFLPPEDIRWAKRIFRAIEGFPQDIFLDCWIEVPRHFLCRVNRHDVVHKLFVHKGRSNLNSPSEAGLISSEKIVFIEILHFPDQLSVEFLLVWGFMEIEVSSENLITSLSSYAHLNSERFNSSAHLVHRSAGSNGRVIECLGVINHLWDIVDSFINSVGESMVFCSEESSDLLGVVEIRRSFQANCERVKFPHALLLYIDFTVPDEFGHDTGNQGRVHSS